MQMHESITDRSTHLVHLFVAAGNAELSTRIASYTTDQKVFVIKIFSSNGAYANVEREYRREHSLMRQRSVAEANLMKMSSINIFSDFGYLRYLTNTKILANTENIKNVNISKYIKNWRILEVLQFLNKTFRIF
jgi:hypothetical protein